MRGWASRPPLRRRPEGGREEKVFDTKTTKDGTKVTKGCVNFAHSRTLRIQPTPLLPRTLLRGGEGDREAVEGEAAGRAPTER